MDEFLYNMGVEESFLMKKDHDEIIEKLYKFRYKKIAYQKWTPQIQSLYVSANASNISGIFMYSYFYLSLFM